MLAVLGLPGGWEWIVVLLVALLIFGSRLPAMLRNVARCIVGFKHEVATARKEIAEEVATEKGLRPDENGEAAAVPRQAGKA